MDVSGGRTNESDQGHPPVVGGRGGDTRVARGDELRRGRRDGEGRQRYDANPYEFEEERR
jgi:hypothetical protein